MFSVLFKVNVPWWFSHMIFLHTASPNPVPPVAVLVVKKGSKIFFKISFLIPIPLSENSIVIKFFKYSGLKLVPIPSVPLPSMASTEFLRMFKTTCLISLKLVMGFGRSSWRDKVKSIFFSPYMNDETRQEMLLEAVKSAKSDKVNNVIKLLVEKRRTEVFGAIADSLTKTSSPFQSKAYS